MPKLERSETHGYVRDLLAKGELPPEDVSEIFRKDLILPEDVSKIEGISVTGKVIKASGPFTEGGWPWYKFVRAPIWKLELLFTYGWMVCDSVPSLRVYFHSSDYIGLPMRFRVPMKKARIEGTLHCKEIGGRMRYFLKDWALV